MSQIISLKCTTCGSSYSINESDGKIVCPNCNSFYMFDGETSDISRFLERTNKIKSFEELCVGIKGIEARAHFYLVFFDGLPEFFKSFVFSNSKVTFDEIKLFYRFKNLEFLYLDDNNLNDDCIEQIQSLKNLIQLNLDGNPISDKGMSYLSGMQNLEVLFLNRTVITNSGLDALQTLQNLKELDLSNNSISDGCISALINIKSLEKLTMRKTRISESGITKLIEHPSLKKIILADEDWNRNLMLKVFKAGGARLFQDSDFVTLKSQEMIDSDLEFVEKFGKLKFLGLDGNQINGIGLKQLGKCKNLSYLSLSNNPIDDNGLKNLKYLPKLKQLMLIKTNVTSKGISSLKLRYWLRNPFNKLEIKTII